MRALIILATLIVPASSIAQPSPDAVAQPRPSATAGAKLDCVANRVQHADQFGSTRPRRLDEMPPGKLYLSVMREVDGCQEMVLVSEERGRLGQRR